MPVTGLRAWRPGLSPKCLSVGDARTRAPDTESADGHRLPDRRLRLDLQPKRSDV